MAGPLPTLNDTTQKENLFAASLASFQSGTINEESPLVNNSGYCMVHIVVVCCSRCSTYTVIYGIIIELLWNYYGIIMEISWNFVNASFKSFVFKKR